VGHDLPDRRGGTDAPGAAVTLEPRRRHSARQRAARRDSGGACTYWARLKFGKAVKRVPLSPSEIQNEVVAWVLERPTQIV